MRRILFTIAALLLPFSTSIGAEELTYNLKNCDRSIIWPAILKDLELRAPDIVEFVKKNIERPTDKPKLTAEDYKQVYLFQEPYHWNISECILLMKEINQLILAINQKSPDLSSEIAIEIKGTLNVFEIPYINSWNMNTYLDIFSMNFSSIKQFMKSPKEF